MQPSLALAQESNDEPVPLETGSAKGKHSEITPYIEAAQVLTAQLSPGDEVLTYTRLAAGVDARITGRRSAASVSLRYERRIGWDDDAVDGDTLSGVARGSFTIIPRAVSLEAGALASRTSFDGIGGGAVGIVGRNDRSQQLYSGYIGPSLKTDLGKVEASGYYRFGYTRVDNPDALVLQSGEAADLLDESTVHDAQLRLESAPRELLPIGVGVEAGLTQENTSNLDQRVRNFHASADVTVPVSRTVALTASIGYEDVEISSRDALRDADDNPVIGTDGRYVTDKSSPRVIAYDVDGIIWDAGVIWRPNRRLSLSANVGRRYGSTTYYGNLSYQPNSRTNYYASVYDTVSGVGGGLTRGLAGLSDDFSASRNPINGGLNGCVSSLSDGNCLTGGLGALRSAAFRSRGVAGGAQIALGRTTFGLGLGYDRREYIGAAGTVLAAADGLVDENYWLSLYLNRRLDYRSSLSANFYTNYFNSYLSDQGDGQSFSASLGYNRQLTAGLSGTAAVGLDGITRDSLPDYWNASAQMGLRYSF
ncbi:preprotein translocase subunit YajC [Altericroceibacterium endophyticum]|uniref:Preprotein translocase subunit YajC n=1 Tax=Altericroceibacterium endophyticum TaxID=1808508 RepID=A0A6I4T6H6_9SPHN|nr:preprotein translocase subunit YajC [Altericroceibacterium endophyticum]MXO66029.1 preprotein translocase subunit YajC [Altericroceibacterium endophyticum]